MGGADAKARPSKGWAIIATLSLVSSLVCVGLSVYSQLELHHLRAAFRDVRSEVLISALNDETDRASADTETLNNRVLSIERILAELKSKFENHEQERLDEVRDLVARAIASNREMSNSGGHSPSTERKVSDGLSALVNMHKRDAPVSREGATPRDVTGGGCPEQCPTGRDGADGARGVPGPRGPPGRNATLDGTNLHAVISEVIQGSTVSGGPTYVRWGRKTCPGDSRLIYDGIAGGSYYGHSGGGTERLCMPYDPEWSKYKEGFQAGAYLYGGEYETSWNYSPQLLSNVNSKGLSLDQNDVPCAVCQAPGRLSKLMIPAKLTCPQDWSLEYKGYLMASRYKQYKSSYDCVDLQPEVVESGQRDHDGALFYHVEATCGALPCPNYVDGREITCVVCTK